MPDSVRIAAVFIMALGLLWLAFHNHKGGPDAFA